MIENLQIDPDGHLGIAGTDWIPRDRTALLVVDMQNYGVLEEYNIFEHVAFPPGGGSAEKYYGRLRDVVVPQTQKLLASCRDHGVPVIYTTYGTDDEQARDYPLMVRHLYHLTHVARGNPEILRVGDRSWQIADAVSPADGELVVNKSTMGAFGATTLEFCLKSLNVRSLIICGGWTNACVETTVRDAVDRGYLITLVEDCCITGDPNMHDATCRVVDAMFGRVLSCEQVIQGIEDLWAD
jgi:nicotinamidase-related amidase